jgi:hypothetical protein
MSSGVVKSASGKTDIPAVQTKIVLGSAAAAKGLTVSAGSFTVTDPGTYFLDVELNAFAPAGDRGFLLELYNETLAAVVVSERSTAPRQDYGEDLWFGWQFIVADVTHVYSFYITPDSAGIGYAGRAIVLDRVNIRGELRQLSSNGSLFGDGRDGSIAFDGVAWRDGDGALLTTVARKWLVNGVTLTLLRNFRFQNVTVGNGGTLLSGRDGLTELFHHRVLGTMTVAAGGIVRAGLSKPNNDNDTASAAGLIGAAAGPDSPAASPMWRIYAGMPGNPGHGGVAVANNTALADAEPTSLTLGAASLTPRGILGTIPGAVPTPSTIAAAAVPADMNFIPSPITPLLPGLNGFAGGAGALDLGGARTASISGVGGAGGRGGGGMRWDVYSLVLIAGSVMHADAEAGGTGGDAVATDLAGDIAGGGGGGAGGGGGMVLCFVRSATLAGVAWTPGAAVAPLIRANGGAAGVAGLGYEFDDVLRPAADGVVGTAGSAGIVGIGRLT